MDLSDPERVAKVYVMQWMHENGLHDALKAMEKEIGLLYDDSQLPAASQLMQLVWRHVEEQAQQDHSKDDDQGDGENGNSGGTDEGGHGLLGPIVGTRPGAKYGGGRSAGPSSQRRHHEEALRLLRAGGDDYAARVVAAEVPAEVHRSNIIAVRMVPEQNCVVTAAGDGYVRCVRYGTDDVGPGWGGPASKLLWETRVSDSALLSLALHPDYSHGLPLVAAGAMDGRVAVLHGPTGATIATLQPHNKYVIRVTWAPGLSSTDESFSGSTEALPGGQVPALILVSASTDETIAISSLDLDDVIVDRGVLEGTRGLCCYSGGGMERGSCAEPGPPPACSDADSNCIGGMKGSSTGGGGAGGDVGAGCSGSGDGRGGEGGEGKRGHPAYELEHLRESEAEGLGRLKIIQQIPYGAAVTDVTFLHSGAGLGSGSGSGCGLGTGPTLVVSVRGSNYLRLLNVAQVVRQEVSATSNKGVPEELVNLNEAGDDHVSFTVKHLVVSPCRKYLLVCTDSPRLLILRTSDWSILRVIFGLPVDQFPQPVGAWHRDSNYIYAAGAGAQLCVFHLGSGRLVHTSVHHKVNVRDLDYDPARNLLATCSFDKTVKILAATDTAVPAVSDAAAASPLKENKAA